MVKIGMVSLLQSAKGTLSLLIFFGALTACLLGKLDSSAFAATVSVVGSIFMMAHASITNANIAAGNDENGVPKESVSQEIINQVRNSISSTSAGK